MGYVMEKLQKYVRLIFNILKCWFMCLCLYPMCMFQMLKYIKYNRYIGYVMDNVGHNP